ncbi:hypothetical protein PZN02_005049 [Sinorhizobium garamanticum]|uniref:Uncharacterized protein n=1 Tax=Sinorhizobium garamanticum TaxID=680247 RepID=A0ABY8DFQ5_9HYPH|nr:hypothetical protein [Sinorhizobium garamanticum]WEX89736.1 hypothetical protein PZN02_005049 [Sinorhizobium garamanticum]
MPQSWLTKRAPDTQSASREVDERPAAWPTSGPVTVSDELIGGASKAHRDWGQHDFPQLRLCRQIKSATGISSTTAKNIGKSASQKGFISLENHFYKRRFDPKQG